MTLVAEDYIRKNYGGKAVRVSLENMQDVAEWCGGVLTPPSLPVTVRAYIHVPVAKSKYMKTDRAFVGDWILCDRDGFKIYKHDIFVRQFELWTSEGA